MGIILPKFMNKVKPRPATPDASTLVIAEKKCDLVHRLAVLCDTETSTDVWKVEITIVKK